MDIKKTAIRDFFLYLLAVVTLYIAVGAFINLLFNYIDALFPDDLQRWHNPYDSIRRSMAMIIIVFPVYISLTWFLRRDSIAFPEKLDFWARKLLLYFTLFLASIVMIADLIMLVNNFLDGELTMRFFLKTLAVLLVAAAVFSYYLWDLKRKTSEISKPSKFLAVLVSVVIAASVVAGFFIAGSPMRQRKLRFDEQRISHLQSLQNEIVNYWTLKGGLPANLDDLKNDISGFAQPKDPVTGDAYSYTVQGDASFELCATFTLETPKYLKADRRGAEPYGQNWNHGAGRACFKRNIDPDLNRLAPYAKPPLPRFAD